MTQNELRDLYFTWLCRLVYKGQLDAPYHRLLYHLYLASYDPAMENDENRAIDGESLRYRFGDENAFDKSTISTLLDDRPCSMLEMMISLSFRCESLMNDPDIGDRTSTWFWKMVKNLGLLGMTNSDYSRVHVNHILDRFMMNDYSPSGRGGLFHIPASNDDLRKVEIWGQMCRYLNYILEKGEI